MEKNIYTAASKVVEALITNNAVRATKFVSPRLVIRATRVRYDKRIDRHNVKIVLTIGGPNYIERDFVRDCKKAGEPFPVKKIQLKLYNPPKKELKRKK